VATATRKKRAAAKTGSTRRAVRKNESRAKKLLRKTVRAAVKAGARSVRGGLPAPFTGARAQLAGHLAHFAAGSESDIEYVRKMKRKGHPVVAMFCEFTPYEMVLAAGGVVVAMFGEEQASLNTEATLPMALCPWARSGLGHAFSGDSPLFEMADLVIADGSCESKRRMQEMLSEHKPVHILELPARYAARRDGWYHWRVEVMKLRARLEKQFNADISDQRLHDAIREANHERAILKSIFDLTREGGWILDCEELVPLLPTVRCAPDNVAALERLNRALHRATSGARRRRVSEQRVLLVGSPAGRGAAAVVDANPQAGARVNPQALAPAIEKIRTGGDPLDSVAEKYLDMPCTCAPGGPSRLGMVQGLVEYFLPDAAVVLDLDACGHGVEEMTAIVDYLEARSNLPVDVVRDDPAAADGEVLIERMAALLDRTSRARKRRTA
jgi:benzoyl-CoA reductase/2-hydroxyglutaryl-CoA dehydratase subunit BcrC/BadD/HgdB